LPRRWRFEAIQRGASKFIAAAPPGAQTAGPRVNRAPHPYHHSFFMPEDVHTGQLCRIELRGDIRNKNRFGGRTSQSIRNLLIALRIGFRIGMLFDRGRSWR